MAVRRSISRGRCPRRGARCADATCGACCGSRSRCTRGRGHRASSSPSSPSPTSAPTSSPRSTAASSGYGGVMYVLPDAHITTVAVDPDRQRGTIGTRLLLGLCRAAVAQGRHRAHPRGAGRPTPRRRASTAGSASCPPAPARAYYADTGEDALVMWAHDIDHPDFAARLAAIAAAVPGTTTMEQDADVTTVLGIETSCDETAAAVVVDATSVLSSVVSSQVDLHARYGGVVPEIASRAHVDLLTPVVAQALVEAGVPDGERRRRGRHRRARPHRLAARRASRRPRRWRSCGTCRSSASTTSRPTSTPGSSTTRRSSCPSSCCSCRAATRCSCTWRATAATGCWARRSTTPPARPSTRWPATSASATRAVRRSTASPWTATPAAIRVPAGDGRRQPTTSASPGSRRRSINHVRKHPEVTTADVAASFQEAVVDVLVTKARRAAEAVGAKGMCLGRWGGGQLAAARAVPRRLRRRRPPRLRAEPGHVHRQRRHGGGGRLLAPPARRPDPPRRRRRPQPPTPRRQLVSRHSWHSSVASASAEGLRLALVCIEC